MPKEVDIGTCEQDGCDSPATWCGPDPYLDEVFPEDGPYNDELWCDECYDNRHDEV